LTLTLSSINSAILLSVMSKITHEKDLASKKALKRYLASNLAH